MINVESERFECSTNIISVMSAWELIRKWCEVYLPYILDMWILGSELDQVLAVREFPDIFPKELSGLPPEREVEFAIKLAPRIASISIAPYKMAVAELKELKALLQELLSWGFI